jgi:outer membrane protein OmpU
MNNLKKIGLTALAGSMVAVSAANAIEMTANGKAKITWVDEAGGNAVAAGDVTGNPYGYEQAISFTASGETEIGTASLYFKHEAGSVGSSFINFDMGDAGQVSMETGSYGLAGLNAYKDVLPRAGGAEQAWDDTDGDAYLLAQADATNMFGYRNSVAGFDITASYAKNGGSAHEDDSNADAGDDSDKTIVVSTSSLMDGFTVGAGYGKLDDADSLDIQKHATMFAKYAAGPVTVGYQYAEINEDDNDSKANMFGVSFNVNENIAVSYNMRDVEIGSNAATPDQEDTGIAASYTMGGMSLSAFQNKSDNVAGTRGREDEVTQVTLSFSF